MENGCLADMCVYVVMMLVGFNYVMQFS